MSSSSLQDKTVRPGSFKGLYYYSDRHQVSQATAQATAKPKRSYRKLLAVLVVAVVLGGWYYHGQADKQPASSSSAQTQKSIAPATAAPATSKNYCAGNGLDKFILIGVEKRHLWACEGTKTVYDTPVITGLRGHPETETPVGTYKIYGKMTNTTLTGSDSRGSWKDPVYYWMPFLDNQYGTYGFHDATWRDSSAFGKISPDSQDASHGCVELPLAASKWLYEWAPVGTTVRVED
jgi:hypothetical protein